MQQLKQNELFCREKQLSYNSLSLDINPSASRTSVGDIWKRYFKICLSLPIWRFAQAREPQKNHDGNKQILLCLCRTTEPSKLIGQTTIAKQIKISSLIITMTENSFNCFFSNSCRRD